MWGDAAAADLNMVGVTSFERSDMLPLQVGCDVVVKKNEALNV